LGGGVYLVIVGAIGEADQFVDEAVGPGGLEEVDFAKFGGAAEGAGAV
jgi:hypothetical protein